MDDNSISIDFLKRLDFTKLTKINTLLIENKKEIIDKWINSERLSAINNSIHMSKHEFKTVYAENIFAFFLSFSTVSYSYKVCPIARKFLNVNRTNENIIEIMILICSEFKNHLNSAIYLSNIPIEEKIETSNIYNAILDSNLSLLLAEYNNYLMTVYSVNIDKLQTLEESSLLTKTDINGVITFVSNSYCKLSGYSKEELIGNTFNIMRHPDVPSRVYEQIWKRLKAGKSWKGRLKNYNKIGEEIVYYTKIMPDFDFEHNIVGYTAIKTDLTDKVNARRDLLTGIMNRLSFNEKINSMIKYYYMKTSSIYLVLIDIDHFKNVNDTHGHVVGDEVLKYFTSIVKKNIRNNDVFARWGGEEFVLLFEDIPFDVALQSVERVRKALEEATFPVIGQKTASFGMVSFSDECDSITDFLEKADECLYHSKNNGRNTISYSTSCSKTPIILHKTKKI